MTDAEKIKKISTLIVNHTRSTGKLVPATVAEQLYNIVGGDEELYDFIEKHAGAFSIFGIKMDHDDNDEYVIYNNKRIEYNTGKLVDYFL